VSAERLTLRWVSWYTRVVSGPARDERRALIESDLWEHRTEAGPGLLADFQILSRAVRGVPADLSWRRARRRDRRLPAPRTLAKGLGWAAAAGSYVFAVTMLGFSATAAVRLGLYGDDWPPGELAYFSRVSATLFTLFVAGALLLRRFPRLGVLSIVTACVGTLTIFWWMIPMTAPMSLAITGATIVLARRRRRTLARRRAGGDVGVAPREQSIDSPP
jgi:hypothetical protein